MVDSLEKRELYKDLINKYGEKQVIVAIEELSELQKELCKNQRGRKNQLALTEEIAEKQKELNILQQIKSELEAWEIIKHSISKEHLEDYQIRTMYGENPFMNINEKEQLIIKKALEVKE